MSEDTDFFRRVRVISSDPVRMHLGELLKYEGRPMSTRELERRIASAKGGIDHHLSELAGAGWIRKETDAGRDSTWVSTSDGVRWSDAPVDDPKFQAVVDEMHWNMQQRRVSRMRKYDAQRQMGVWSDGWVEASMSHDFLVGMVPEDLVDFEAEVQALIAKYRAREHKHVPGAESVFISVAAFPWRFDD